MGVFAEGLQVVDAQSVDTPVGTLEGGEQRPTLNQWTVVIAVGWVC